MAMISVNYIDKENSMKKEDMVKIDWEQNRDSAIKFGKSLVESMMKNYQEPTRAGTRRGDSIGFSWKKKWAAFLMILYNPDSGLGLKEIAKIADAKPDVLRVWRTETAFKKAESEACKKVGELIRDTANFKLMEEEIQAIKKKRKEDGPDKLSLLLLGKQTIFKILKSEKENPTPFIKKFLVEEVKKRKIKVIEIDDSGKTSLGRSRLKIEDCDDPDEAIDTLTRHLLYFNPLVAQPLIETLREKIDMDIMGYVGIAVILRVGCEITDEKSLRRWRARPEIKDVTKKMIETWIRLISDPEARKELGPEEVQKRVEDLKTFIFRELDLL
jgi:hypothetical protein